MAIESFSEKLLNSFYLYVDYLMCKRGELYSVISSQFYRTAENRLPFDSYSSPYKTHIYDGSIGVPVMSGVSGSAGFIPRGTDGLKIDYMNGRILIDQGVTSSYSGTYALRDFNLYVNNDDEYKVVFENAYRYNNTFGINTSGCIPRDFYLPAVFINWPKTFNEPFAFGGEDQTKATIRLTAITNEYNKLIKLNSLFVDHCNTCFPMISTNDVPLNFYGDLKTGYYNYETLRDAAEENDNNALVRIDYVSSSILQDRSVKRARGEIVSFIEFNLSTLRYPRQYYS